MWQGSRLTQQFYVGNKFKLFLCFLYFVIFNILLVTARLLIRKYNKVGGGGVGVGGKMTALISTFENFLAIDATPTKFCRFY